MTDPIRAPWTPEQVAALNAFQQRGGMHPFTCGGDHTPGSPALVAHEDGWHCPQPYGEPCDYRQDWAHAFMADPGAWPKWPFGERHGPTPEEVQAAVSNARAHNASLAIPPRTEVNRYARLGPAVQALIDDYDQIALALLYVTTKEHLDRAEAELQQHAEAESADAAAGSYANGNEHAIAHPQPWLHILFTSPDETTANTSALALADHLTAEFSGVGMRITTNADEAGA